jgi:hypothetical protein
MNMNSKDLANEICNQLFNLKYKSKGYDWESNVISEDNKKTVLVTVQAVVNDHYSQRVSELEAKVFVYEEMIKKSNFAPMIEKAIE